MMARMPLPFLAAEFLDAEAEKVVDLVLVENAFRALGGFLLLARLVDHRLPGRGHAVLIDAALLLAAEVRTPGSGQFVLIDRFVCHDRPTER